MIKQFFALLFSITLSASVCAAGFVSGNAFLTSTLWNLDGKPVAMDYFKDKPVLVNFWASWCAGCIEEVKDLNALKSENAGRFDVVGVSIDDDLKLVRDFTRKTGIAYHSFIGGGLATPMMKSMGNSKNGVPYTVLINKKGAIVYYKLGILQKNDWFLLKEVIRTQL